MAPGSMSSTLLALTMTSTPWGVQAAIRVQDQCPGNTFLLPSVTHLEELGNLGYVAGTGAFAGIWHVLTHLWRPGRD